MKRKYVLIPYDKYVNFKKEPTSRLANPPPTEKTFSEPAVAVSGEASEASGDGLLDREPLPKEDIEATNVYPKRVSQEHLAARSTPEESADVPLLAPIPDGDLKGGEAEVGEDDCSTEESDPSSVKITPQRVDKTQKKKKKKKKEEKREKKKAKIVVKTTASAASQKTDSENGINGPSLRPRRWLRG